YRLRVSALLDVRDVVLDETFVGAIGHEERVLRAIAHALRDLRHLDFGISNLERRRAADVDKVGGRCCLWIDDDRADRDLLGQLWIDEDGRDKWELER